jgi:hypothetical protein
MVQKHDGSVGFADLVLGNASLAEIVISNPRAGTRQSFNLLER